MADPTNRNDPDFANNPDYVFVGGRWQNKNNGTGTDPNAPAAGGSVRGSTVPHKDDILFGPKGLFGADGPLGDPNRMAANNLRMAGVGGEINNFAGYQDIARKFREGAIRGQATNPYDAAIADRSRGAQMALINQMRGTMNGPSVAAMQGQRALGQSGQQALMNAALGGGRGAMLQSANVGAGLAGDVGQARLGEVMRSQAGMGGAAGNLRGGDLRSADAQMGAGFAAQNIADQRARFYGSQGARLDQARAQAEADNQRLLKQLGLDIAGRQMNMGMQVLGAGATGVTQAVGMGKK